MQELQWIEVRRFRQTKVIISQWIQTNNLDPYFVSKSTAQTREIARLPWVLMLQADRGRKTSSYSERIPGKEAVYEENYQIGYWTDSIHNWLALNGKKIFCIRQELKGEESYGDAEGASGSFVQVESKPEQTTADDWQSAWEKFSTFAWIDESWFEIREVDKRPNEPRIFKLTFKQLIF